MTDGFKTHVPVAHKVKAQKNKAETVLKADPGSAAADESQDENPVRYGDWSVKGRCVDF